MTVIFKGKTAKAQAYNNFGEFCEMTTIRRDTFPVRIFKRDGSLVHLRVEGNPLDYLRYHVLGTRCDMVSSVGGKMRNAEIKVGRYLNEAHGLFRFVCLDFDDHKDDFNRNAYEAFVMFANKAKIKFMELPSDTGKGIHIYILLDRVVPISLLITASKSLCSGVSIDNFPLSARDFGGNLWYPFCHTLSYQKKEQIIEKFSDPNFIACNHAGDFLRACQELDSQIPKEKNGDSNNQFLTNCDKLNQGTYYSIKNALEKVDPRWIYGDRLVAYSDSKLWVNCKDLRSETGDLHPSMRVWNGAQSLGRVRGTVYAFRDGSMYLPWDYLVAFRGFNRNSALRFLYAKAGVQYVKGQD